MVLLHVLSFSKCLAFCLSVVLFEKQPSNMRHSPIVGSMLGQRRRGWAVIDPTMGECFMFAGQVNAFRSMLAELLTNFAQVCQTLINHCSVKARMYTV